MKNKILTTLVVLFLLSVMLAGCVSQKETAVVSKKTVKTDTPDERTPEEVLAKEIADGKLVEVYDEYVRMSPGGIEKNWMIINNVKDADEEFTVIPCGGCDFENRIFEVPAGEYKIIQFKVRAMEGQKEIKVRDHLNNAYGYATISVIVE